MSVCSCADNLFVEENGPDEHVNFNIVTGDYVTTRSAEVPEDQPQTAVCLGTEDEGLWLTSEFESQGGDMPATRGVQVTNGNLASEYGKFKVRAYTYGADSDWESGKSAAEVYILDEAISVSMPRSSHFWPFDESNLRFYAYAPVSAEGAIFSFDDNKNLTLSYTVPSAVADQKDILIASPVDVASSNRQQNVNLYFHHVLTSIRLKAQPSEYLSGTVKSVTFRNVAGTGSYNCGETSWTLGEKSDFTVEPNVELVYNPEGDNPVVDLVSGDNTLIMIPQILAEGAELEVVVDSDGEEKVLKANLSGKGWPMDLVKGKTVIYTIRSEYEFHLETTPEVTDYIEPETTGINYKGGEIVIDVNSNQILSDGSLKQATWVIDDEYEIPKWATIDEDHDEDLIKITLSRVDPTYTTDHHDLLLKNPSVSGVYDLSTKGGTTAMNTANCYIVNAPGKYKLPLVYGNAIVDGAANPSSYTPIVSGDYVMPQVNHLGNQITSPYIYENEGCTPIGATLIWMDTKDGTGGTYEEISPDQGLVRNVALDEDKKYLTFDVDQSSMRQGNAIVAVYGRQGIMWSWHIWITDYEPLGVVLGVTEGYEPDRNHDESLLNFDRIVKNYTGQEYTFMPINLGWVYTKDVLYAERSFKIRIKQVVTGQYEDIEIVQPGDRVIDGYNPYFQMFRKDPFAPGSPEPTSIKDVYITNLNYLPRRNTHQYSQNNITFLGGYGATIKYPHMQMSVGTGSQGNDVIEYFNGNMARNLWNNACNTLVTEGREVQTTIKTIYDPTPVGYCVPPICAFSGFTQDGLHKDADDANFGTDYQNTYFLSTDDYREHSAYFGYCFPMSNKKYGDLWIKPHYDGLINFPARGEITHDTASLINITTTTGVCSSSLPIGNKHIIFYAFPSRAIYSMEFRGRAFSMRAIRYEGDVRYDNQSATP